MHCPELRLGPMTDLPGRKECGAQDDVADKDQEAGGDGDGHQRKVFHKFKLYNFFHVRHGHPGLSWCFRGYSLQERGSLGWLCLPGCLRRLLCVLHCPVKVDNIPQNICWSLLGTPSTASTHPSETILPAHPAVAGDGAPAIVSLISSSASLGVISWSSKVMKIRSRRASVVKNSVCLVTSNRQHRTT